MANISIRKLDDNVLHRIKLQAIHHKVSMEEEVRSILKQGVQENECVGDAAVRIFSCTKHGEEEQFNLPKRQAHNPMSFNRQ